jgi:hypothetical protein
MRRHSLRPWVCLLSIAIWSVASAQTGEPKTVNEALDRYVRGPERACLVLARAMPEESLQLCSNARRVQRRAQLRPVCIVQLEVTVNVVARKD